MLSAVLVIVFVIAVGYTLFNFAINELTDTSIINTIGWLSLNVALSPLSKSPVEYSLLCVSLLLGSLLYLYIQLLKPVVIKK